MRGGGVGFLDEALHRAHPGFIQRRAGFNVAVTGFRRGRHDAEGDQPTRFGVKRGLRHGGAKAFAIGDDVIGRQDQQQRIDALVPGVQRRHRHRRRGIAAHRLQNHHRRLDADRAQLLGHHEAVFLIAHHQRRGDVFGGADPQRGVLQHGVLVDQREKLFGIGLARERPQPRAATPGEDDGNDHARSPRPMA